MIIAIFNKKTTSIGNSSQGFIVPKGVCELKKNQLYKITIEVENGKY